MRAHPTTLWPAVLLTCCAALGVATAAYSQQPSVNVPPTLAPERQAWLVTLSDPPNAPAFPVADESAGGAQRQPESKAENAAVREAVVPLPQPAVRPMHLSGVPVVDVKPQGWTDNRQIVIYTHGGGSTLSSAQSTLFSVALMASTTGLRVIAVDYPVTPGGTWQDITAHVVSVVKALLTEGYALKNMAIFGDAAGGSLAVSAVVQMRDQGLGMPAAVVLWAPWADLTAPGATATPLTAAEPNDLSATGRTSSAAADPSDPQPRAVSPGSGDASRGFPPTLIQGSTKAIFLHNFHRQSQAIESAGGTAQLDLYEGMTHVFQPRLPQSPEGQLALKKMKQFLEQSLGN
jgi:epsilon-lactone hydrolase